MTVAYPMEQAFHTTHIDNDDDQIIIASSNPTRNAPYHCYSLVVPEYVKTRKADLIYIEIWVSCNKSALSLRHKHYRHRRLVMNDFSSVSHRME